MNRQGTTITSAHKLGAASARLAGFKTCRCRDECGQGDGNEEACDPDCSGRTGSGACDCKCVIACHEALLGKLELK